MNNIHGVRINEDRLTPAGSGYVDDGEPDSLFANDAWSQFISLQVGPNGQMVLIDWYDRNQCHERGPESHDRSNGRIFKVIHGEANPVQVDLARESDRRLVEWLEHENEWFSRHARRLLQERAAAGRLAADTPKLLDDRVATAKTLPVRLRAIWSLHVVGRLDEPRLMGLCTDPEPVVRGWAIQLAAERKTVSPALLEQFARLAATDPSPVVRLALCSALQRIPPAARWPICTPLVAHAVDANDHNLPLMNWYAIEPLVPLDPARALALAADSRIPTVSRFIVRRAASEESGYEPLVDRLTHADSATRRWMLEELVTALAARGRMAAPPAWQRGYELLAEDSDEVVGRLARLVAVPLDEIDERVLSPLGPRVSTPRAHLTWDERSPGNLGGAGTSKGCR